MSDDEMKLTALPHMPIRTFECVVYVSQYMEGNINDWPKNIQDGIYAAMERLASVQELPLTIVASYCGMDYGEAIDHSEDKPYVHVILSEIVAGLSPEAEREMQRAAMAQIDKRKMH